MLAEELKITQSDVRKLLGAASPDAALLYLYIQSGNSQEKASEELQLSQSRLSCAAATLRQLGLWPEKAAAVIPTGERPNYTEQDVLTAVNGDDSFRALYGEVQRLMGRTLNTEELKIILGFVRYLGLPGDVITVLVCYCKDRIRQRGGVRNPSLRAIEKEAYSWAERGIDTMEEAAAYIQGQNVRNTRLTRVMRILQIHGRNLTPAEERYVQSWMDMGIDDEQIASAYEKTCLNTGNLNWNYMNKILQRWHEEGVQPSAGKSPAVKRRLDSDEEDAIRRLLQEG